MTDEAQSGASAQNGPQKIGGFILRNNGAFVCSGKVMYMEQDGSSGTTDGFGNIMAGQQETMRPSDKGIAQGTLIQLYIDIMAGSDRTGGTYYRYGPGSNNFAQYSITGTTLFSDVHFEGIVQV